MSPGAQLSPSEHLSPATWLWTPPHPGPAFYRRPPSQAFLSCLGISLVPRCPWDLPASPLPPPHPAMVLGVGGSMASLFELAHPNNPCLCPFVPLCRLAQGGLSAHRLTWEDELLLVFVVVGCLQKNENTHVSAAPWLFLQITNRSPAATVWFSAHP